MPMSGHGVPPIAASRIACTPQVGASSHAIGPAQPGSSDSGTSMPVTSSTGHSSMFESAFAFRYSTKVEANTKPSSPSPRIVAGTATHERRPVHDVEGDPEDEPSPDQRGRERVDPDHGGRERQRGDDEHERGRRRDEHLERPLPALPLDRPARAEQGRRPDPVDGGAERHVEQAPRLVAGLVHVVRDRGHQQRHEDRCEQEEDGVGECLDVEAQPDQEHAQAAHARSSVAWIRLCHSSTRIIV